MVTGEGKRKVERLKRKGKKESKGNGKHSTTITDTTTVPPVKGVRGYESGNTWEFKWCGKPTITKHKKFPWVGNRIK
jgi:hypothetical protein